MYIKYLASIFIEIVLSLFVSTFKELASFLIHKQRMSLL